MHGNHGDFQEAVSEVMERSKSLARTRNVDGKKFEGTFPFKKQCVCVCVKVLRRRPLWIWCSAVLAARNTKKKSKNTLSFKYKNKRMMIQTTTQTLLGSLLRESHISLLELQVFFNMDYVVLYVV